MEPFLTQYQSANLSNEQSIDNFVVRTKEFERVMADIRTTDRDSSFQHYVFVGRRGSGKSTLLRRIQAEVCTDPNLKEKFIVTNLSEEQAGIYKIYDLWDYVIRDLRAKDFSLPEIDWQEYQDDLKEYTKVLYGTIHDLLHKEDKRLILLVDNIDRIFKNIGKDANLLREQLMNFNDVRIIGGSTIMAEGFWRYDMPFYQFFSIKRLEPLTMEEIKMLLEHWAEAKGNPEIAKFVERHPGKIQAVRMLTDGTPRTMQLFVDMLVNRDDQQGFDYLRRIIDNATPIYQERLGQLSHQQQKIVTELSFFWEAASIEQLVPVCKMTSKNISAQMAQLVKSRVVEKVKGEKKNMYYRLEERFFNLWLLMTQGGPKQKREAKYLTVFLETWYDRDEIRAIYSNFIMSLNFGKITRDFAASMGKALAHSQFLTILEQSSLITQIKAQLPDNSEWARVMPESAIDLCKRAYALASKGKSEAGIRLVEGIEQEDDYKQKVLADLYFKAGRIEESERICRIRVEKGVWEAYIDLATLYESQKKDIDAEASLNSALEKEVLDALPKLAEFFVRQGRLAEAEKCFMQAIEKRGEDLGLLIDIGQMYEVWNKLDLAEEYYFRAADKGANFSKVFLAKICEKLGRPLEAEEWLRNAYGSDPDNGYILSCLAEFLYSKKNVSEAVSFYLKAIEKGSTSSLVSLANIFQEMGQFDEAENLLIKATKQKPKRGFFAFSYAIFLWKQQRINEAEKWLLKAISLGDVLSLKLLGLLYDSNGKLHEAIYCMKQAIDKDVEGCYVLLGQLLEKQGSLIEAEDAYRMGIESKEIGALVALSLNLWSQGKLLAAEKYLISAADEGRMDALRNLAVFYYQQNRESDNALELISKARTINRDDEWLLILESLFQLWSGKMEAYQLTRDTIVETLARNSIEKLGYYFFNLMSHNQVNFVLEQLRRVVDGSQIKDLLMPTYYAVLTIADSTNPELLGIPPELETIVSGVVAEIKKRQNYYGSTSNTPHTSAASRLP